MASSAVPPPPSPFSPPSPLPPPCHQDSPSWPPSLLGFRAAWPEGAGGAAPPDLRRRLSLARGQVHWPRARESLCARFLGMQHKPRWTRRDDSQGLKLTRCSRLGEAQDQAPGAPKGRLGKAKCGVFSSASSLLLLPASSSRCSDADEVFSLTPGR